VWFMHCKGLTLCQRTTLVLKLLTDYLQKLMAYQHHTICLHLKGHMEHTSFSGMLPRTTTEAKGSKSVLVKRAGHEKQRITVTL
jgi:hypothetical protein